MDYNDLKVFEKLNQLVDFKTNDVLVDCGANHGDYTDFFISKIAGSGKIYTVELFPETCKKLETKYVNNKNVIIYNNAIYDKNEEIEFYFGSFDDKTHNVIGHDMNFKKNKQAGKIKAITLDEMLKNEKQIKLIKIDIEGAELSALKGGSETFSKVKFLLIENHLDQDWPQIKEILFNNFKTHINIMTNEILNKDSKRPYQCLCFN